MTPVIIIDKKQLDQQYDNVLSFYQVSDAGKNELKQYMEVAYQLGKVEVSLAQIQQHPERNIADDENKNVG